MSILFDFEAVLTRIRSAVVSTLETDVADAARDALSEKLGGYDFPYSRGSGGLTDPRNFEATVDDAGDEITLTVRDVAPFQRPTNGGKSLAEVVISGDPHYMGSAGSRPFMDEAQEALDAGRAEEALRQGLRRRGIIVK